MLLYLVRHGGTEMSDRNIIQGHLNPSLSPQGKAEVDHLAEHLRMVPFKEAWAGDLARSEETAQAILAYHPRIREKLISTPLLRARGMGSLEGQVWEDGMKYPADVEPAEQLTKRLHTFLASLIEAHTPSSSPVGTPRSPASPTGPGSGVILAVTHQECLAELLRILTGDAELSRSEGTLVLPTAQKNNGSGPSSAEHAHANGPPNGHLQPGDASTNGHPHIGDASTNGGPDRLNAVMDVRVPATVDTSVRPEATAVAIVRVWWTEGDVPGSLEARGRLECWGEVGHLGQLDV